MELFEPITITDAADSQLFQQQKNQLNFRTIFA